MSIQSTFRKTFNNQPNFITPNLVRYGTAGSYLYELASGEGIMGGTTYGVTVLTKTGSKTNASKGGFSEYAAEKYIKDLKMGLVSVETRESYE